MKLYTILPLYAAQWILATYAADLGLFARSQASPSPLSIPPSQNWYVSKSHKLTCGAKTDTSIQGWSWMGRGPHSPYKSAALRRMWRVLVSPASDDTLVVSSAGCVGSTDSSCTNDRGGTFNPNSSSSWQQHGYYQLNVEPALNVPTQAVYGNDTVTLGIQGSGGPTLQNQIVAAYAGTEMYLGMFGLNPSSTNFTATDLDRQSYLSSLKAANLIPSLSFGYTAGNQYRLKQVYGSLTLGGYDSSLFTPNNITIPLAPGPTRQLLAGLQKDHFEESERDRSRFDGQ